MSCFHLCTCTTGETGVRVPAGERTCSHALQNVTLHFVCVWNWVFKESELVLVYKESISLLLMLHFARCMGDCNIFNFAPFKRVLHLRNCHSVVVVVFSCKSWVSLMFLWCWKFRNKWEVSVSCPGGTKVTWDFCGAFRVHSWGHFNALFFQHAVRCSVARCNCLFVHCLARGKNPE